MTDSTNFLWTQPNWLAEVTLWIEQELHRQGIERRGAIAQPHIRQWSTVLQVPTSTGKIYFKAVIPDLSTLR